MNNKRKAVVLASSILGCVCIASAGFAAWVITNNAEHAANGNIVVDTVADKSITLSTTWKDSKDSLVFGWGDYTPQGSDWLVNTEPSTAENLSVTLVITVDKLANLSDAGVTYTIEAVANTESYPSASYANAVSNNLVSALPESATIAKSAFASAEDGTGTYSLELHVTWGSAFGGQNPLKYYNGQTYTAELAATAKTNLEKLNTYLTGVSFKVTLTAKSAA